ncbi:NAD(P)-dependent oxidoreductase [Dyadobacter sp. LHD-138]|uniref:NAD(P)-dependent oxidoreductase n=1 Tax=Dyadobacter sp. LHD-138 TaxID=3071413 RepID=UPI0027E20C69|nr:NAD(P)-dependent oxidoreductase [Dyadobacter sp. LHD-138]MDQ6478216.1 NAD(P)-dependent oxidoreductase [Dyadobacter sp. LHD-138]
MKVALIGATGFVGSHVLTELTNRGHEVTAIVRDPSKVTLSSPLLTVKQGDVFNTEELAAIFKGNDIVISAYNPGWTNPNIYADFLKGSASIQEATKKSGVKRYLTVGGAGSLEIAPGLQLVDTPEFPEAYKPGATAAREYLNILKNETELDWTFLSPAIEMHQGTAGVRRGTYRTALNNPVFDENGRSILSVEDLAVAIVDETEQPKYIKKRFTAAY